MGLNRLWWRYFCWYRCWASGRGCSEISHAALLGGLRIGVSRDQRLDGADPVARAGGGDPPHRAALRRAPSAGVELRGHGTASADNPATNALWQAHKARLAALLARLRVGNPSPRADRYDPFALRALLLMGVVLVGLAVGDSASDRLRPPSASARPMLTAESRVDAWVTPPVYTGRPPIILADGSRADRRRSQPVAAAGNEQGIIEVPESSQLVIRATGAKGFVLEVTPDGKPTERIEAKAPAAATPRPAQGAANAGAAPPPSDVAEAKLELKTSSKIRIVGVSRPRALAVRVIPGSAAEDLADQGSRADAARRAEAHLQGRGRLRRRLGRRPHHAGARKAGDPATQWARREANKGPRPPLERPPVLALRLPRANAKAAEGTSYHELGGHPWAGMRVQLQLAGQGSGRPDRQERAARVHPAAAPLQQPDRPRRGRAAPLAGRGSAQPAARVAGASRRSRSSRRTSSPTSAPIWACARPTGGCSATSSRGGIKSVVEQLWHVALRLEDGNLSDAERRAARGAGEARQGAAGRRFGGGDPPGHERAAPGAERVHGADGPARPAAADARRHSARTSRPSARRISSA